MLNLGDPRPQNFSGKNLKTILIIGGAGYIVKVICRQLHNQKYLGFNL